MIVKRKPTFPVGEVIGENFTIKLCTFCVDEVEVYLGSYLKEEKAVAILYRLRDEKYNTAIFKAYEKFTEKKESAEIDVFERNTVSLGNNNLAYILLKLPGKPLNELVSDYSWPLASTIDFGIELCQTICALEQEKIIPALAPEIIWIYFEKNLPRIFLPVICSLHTQEDIILDFIHQGENSSKRSYLIGKLLFGLLNGKLAESFEAKAENQISAMKEIQPKSLSDTLIRCLYPPKNNDYQLMDLILDLEICKKDIVQKYVSSDTLLEKTTYNEKPKGLAKVAGMQKLKELLVEEVIGPLKNPSLYQRFGLTWPNGILLFGPPGCGKTYISRQLAEELGFYFIELIPSEIASSYMHDTTLRIRHVFKKAENNAPAVVFIDEVDAMVPIRGTLGSHQEYKSEEITEFLVQLNDCAKRKILIIAATNEPEKIDPAILRTGRIDKVIFVGPPDEEARKALLEMYLLNRPVVQGLDLVNLSKKLEGYSCSDIKNLVDEAARIAIREKAISINEIHFIKAIKRNPPGIDSSVLEKYAKFSQRGGE